MQWMRKVVGKIRGDAGQAYERLYERRQKARVGCRLSGRARCNGNAFQVEIRECSLNGLRFFTRSPLVAGERVQLTGPRAQRPRGRQTLMCRVVWCHPQENGFIIGLVCPAGLRDSWLASEVGDLGPSTRARRRHRRFELSPEQVQVRLADQSRGALLNLGLGGARVRSRLAAEPGEMVKVVLSGEALEPIEMVAAVVSSVSVNDDRHLLNLRFLRDQASLSQLSDCLLKVA